MRAATAAEYILQGKGILETNANNETNDKHKKPIPYLIESPHINFAKTLIFR